MLVAQPKEEEKWYVEIVRPAVIELEKRKQMSRLTL